MNIRKELEKLGYKLIKNTKGFKYLVVPVNGGSYGYCYSRQEVEKFINQVKEIRNF